MSAEDRAATANKYGNTDLYGDVAAKLGVSREKARALVLAEAYGLLETPLDKVARFHRKFGLPGVEQDKPRHLTYEEALFRIQFMIEELAEYSGCSGFVALEACLKELCSEIKRQLRGELDLDTLERTDHRDFHGQLDALVDLSYVLHGTALFHGFSRFDQAFDTVHAANMAKVRATSADESKRGSKLDVVKPVGWTAPVLTEFLS